MSEFSNQNSTETSGKRSRYFRNDANNSRNGSSAFIDLTESAGKENVADEPQQSPSNCMEVDKERVSKNMESMQNDVDPIKEKKGRKSSPFFGKKRKGNKSLSTPPVLEKSDTCAICLGSASNPAKLDSCIHVFCFDCIDQWAKIKLDCPYCKVTFKTATYRDNATGLCKRIEFEEPEAAAESADEEYGYFEEEDYDEDEDSDYEPRSPHEGLHGYDSDGGFIVSDEEGGESSYEEESFYDDLEAAEAAMEVDRMRTRNRRGRRVGRRNTTTVDLVSPEMAANETAPSSINEKSVIMDLVSPESVGSGGTRSADSPVDLLSRFGFKEDKNA